ncbi:MAG: DUF308 domain-containing protein [Spirochaetales bacterium]|jgi:uncharacterized membrane protein HdeD (DUF308 family)|nr:DUF308 domain-containing protein [Spirochaetales bacterium]
MDENKKWMQQFVLGICTMIIGAFIFFQTKDFTMFLSIAIGIYAVVNGVIVFSSAVKTKFSQQVKTAMLIRGSVSFGVGLLALFLPLVFVKISWTFVLYILGLQLLASAGLQVYLAVELKKLDMPVLPRGVEAGVSLVMAFLIFTMPNEIGMTIIKVAGFIVFAYGLLIVVRAFRAHMASETVEAK